MRACIFNNVAPHVCAHREAIQREAIQRVRQLVKLAVKLVVSYAPLHALELLACMRAAERHSTEKQSRALCVCSGSGAEILGEYKSTNTASTKVQILTRMQWESGAVSNLRAARGGNTRRRCMPARDSVSVCGLKLPVYEALSYSARVDAASLYACERLN